MTVFLDRIDSVPVINSNLDMQLMQWLAVLVDSLNEDIADIEGAISSTVSVTTTTQNIEINTNYIPTNVLLTTFQLPDFADVGDNVSITGFGAGGWKILTGTGQTIKVADVGGSASVSIASSSRYDAIAIRCVEANKTWVTVSSQTTGFVIV